MVVPEAGRPGTGTSLLFAPVPWPPCRATAQAIGCLPLGLKDDAALCVTWDRAVGDVILTVEVSQPGEGVVLVRCDGEVDPSTCDRLIEATEWSFTPTLRLLRLNFLAVTFMDSTGVQFMFRAQDRCAQSGV